MPTGVYIRTEYHRAIIRKSKVGIKYPNRKKISLEDRRKLSEIHKRIGSKPPSRKGIKHNELTKRKVSENNAKHWLGRKFSDQHRKNISKANKGKVVWNKGRGDKTSLNKRVRNSIQYKNWRIAVFERDNYTCWICEERGSYLNSHHLKRFAEYIKLRFEISNGLTLCEFCHNTHTNFRCK